MAFSIKSSLLAWWLVLIIAIFLWYRNYQYDRIISAIAVVLGLFQLIEYGIFNHMDSRQGGKLIFSVLWLLLLIFAIGTLLIVKNEIALIWLIIISTVFLFANIYAFTSDSFNIIICNDYLIWTKEDLGILDGLEWIYILGIIVPFVLLLTYYNWEDFGLYAIIIYLVTSFLIIWYIFGSKLLGSLWVYSLIGMVMLVWFIGMFTK